MLVKDREYGEGFSVSAQEVDGVRETLKERPAQTVMNLGKL
jgi:hypothetical protein